MGPISREEVQKALDSLANQELYLHLETTNGAYAALSEVKRPAVGAYIRNGRVRYHRGVITASNESFRVGLKMDLGWIYAEGLTDWELDGEGRLLLAGHSPEGHLQVALQLSRTPFR